MIQKVNAPKFIRNVKVRYLKNDCGFDLACGGEVMVVVEYNQKHMYILHMHVGYTFTYIIYGVICHLYSAICNIHRYAICAYAYIIYVM